MPRGVHRHRPNRSWVASSVIAPAESRTRGQTLQKRNRGRSRPWLFGPDPDEEILSEVLEIEPDPAAIRSVPPAGLDEALAHLDGARLATAVSEAFRGRLTDENLDLIRATVRDHADFWLTGGAWMPPTPPDWRQELSGYAGQVLVLASSGLDRAREGATVRAAGTLASEATRGRLVKIAAETEFPWLERADETADAILSLIQQLPSSPSEQLT